jgi:hypothetical protein
VSARTLTVLALSALAAAPAAAGAAGPRVDAMVVGRSQVLWGARTVAAGPATLSAGGRACGVAAGTPLAVLAWAHKLGGPAFALRDYGACSGRVSSASGLFVAKVGPDGNRGQDGWVYKVGHRLGTAPAGDSSGPFGTGRRLRSGQRVLWFWCGMGRAGCRRTLDVSAPRTAAPGAALRVRAYDDHGRARAAVGALVTFTRAGAGVQARVDARGRTRIPGGLTAGSYRLQASGAGRVPSFPVRVRIR